jgi:Ca-activated chloride channel family protein
VAATSIADSSSGAPASGSEAVTLAQEAQRLADADMAAPMPAATYVTAQGQEVSAADVLRYAGNQTFVLRDGIWTDTAYNPDHMTVTTVPFASDDYFALLGEHPELGPAFALGQEVIVTLGGTAYQVTAEA